MTNTEQRKDIDRYPRKTKRSYQTLTLKGFKQQKSKKFNNLDYKNGLEKLQNIFEE